LRARSSRLPLHIDDRDQGHFLTAVHQHGEDFPNLHRVLAEADTADPFAIEFELGLNALLRGLLSSPSVADSNF